MSCTSKFVCSLSEFVSFGVIVPVCSLPEKGEYLFEYRNVKEYLDS